MSLQFIIAKHFLCNMLPKELIDNIKSYTSNDEKSEIMKYEIEINYKYQFYKKINSDDFVKIIAVDLSSCKSLITVKDYNNFYKESTEMISTIYIYLTNNINSIKYKPMYNMVLKKIEEYINDKHLININKQKLNNLNYLFNNCKIRFIKK